LFTVFPVYWLVNTSVQPPGCVYRVPPALFPAAVSLHAYAAAIQRGTIFTWIKNSIIVSVGTVLLNLFLAIPAAYSIARFKNRFNGIVMFMILATQMISPAVLVVPLFEIFRRLGLINTLVGLVLADALLTLPIAAFVLIGFFEGLPREIEEAATIDGCSKFAIFFRIALPLVRPALFTVGILIFFDAWNEYMFAYTLVTRQELWVGTVGLASFIGQFYIDWQGMLAHAVLFGILPMMVYLFCRRYIVRGIAEGFGK